MFNPTKTTVVPHADRQALAVLFDDHNVMHMTKQQALQLAAQLVQTAQHLEGEAMAISTPCMDCGELTNATRCEECATKVARLKPATTTRQTTKKTAQQRGYDAAWTRLSKLARQRQPFCSDCGTDEDLQCDHTPEAWQRKEKGLEIRLQDVDVVCGACNRQRGAARGEAARSESKPLKPLVPLWSTREAF